MDPAQQAGVGVTTPLIAVPKYAKLGRGFSRAEKQKANEDPGRPWNRVAGGWIGDLAALQKFIQLCPFCLGKFNPRKSGYEVWRVDTYNVGKCDGCNTVNPKCRGFISEAYHTTVGDPNRRPRRGRWSR